MSVVKFMVSSLLPSFKYHSTALSHRYVAMFKQHATYWRSWIPYHLTVTPHEGNVMASQITRNATVFFSTNCFEQSQGKCKSFALLALF